MATRAQVFEASRLGIEAANTPGTAVPANLRLFCTSIDPSPEISNTPFAPTGGKADTDVLIGKEHTQAGLAGTISFYDLVYLYGSLLAPPTVVTAGGVSTFEFFPSMYEPDHGLLTFTVDTGSAAGATRFTNAFVNGMRHEFTPNAATFTGDMLGKKLLDGIALEANPTAVKKLPALGKGLKVEVGTATNAYTKLTRCMSANLAITDRQDPVFCLDDAEDSFSTTAEKRPGRAAQIVVEQNTAADAYMTALRAADTRFCRITLTGPLIVVGTNYQIVWEFPFKFRQSRRGENQSVHAGTYDMVPIYDATYGGWLKVTIKNSMVSAGTGGYLAMSEDTRLAALGL